MKRPILCALLVITISCLAASQETPAAPPILPAAEAMEMGKKFTANFYANETEPIWARMTDKMKATLGSPDGLREIHVALQKQIGNEKAVLNEQVLPNRQYQVYTRLATFESTPERVVVQFTFSPTGEIAGFHFTFEAPATDTKFSSYKPKTAFTLPFYGYYTVFQGGRSVYENYYAQSTDQRFAYDFAIVRGGRQFEEDAQKLEDYFCFGRPVLSPALGTVVAAVDQYEDNPIGKPSKEAAKMGNNIVIDHGNSEFSMFSHLKHGSLKVKAGAKVRPHQKIASCGNSGSSPFPHIHVHVQNTTEWFKGEGLPMIFHNYVADGKSVAAGEPVRGQVVRDEEK